MLIRNLNIKDGLGNARLQTVKLHKYSNVGKITTGSMKYIIIT